MSAAASPGGSPGAAVVSVVLALALAPAPEPSWQRAPRRSHNSAAVLVNGHFAPGEWSGARVLEAGVEPSVAVMTDEHYLYIGVRFLAEAHTGIDLYLAVPGGDRKKLHVSAALGQAQWSGGTWTDLEWGANALWAANSVGLIVVEGKQSTVPLEGFEFQISRSLLRGSDWRVLLHLKRPDRRVPAAASLDDPSTWLAVDLEQSVSDSR